ncbi:MAG: ankyrin repeat domain-containing protein [Sumerlaeia bacterium]
MSDHYDFFQAARAGDIGTLRALLAGGAPLDAVDHRGRTVLWCAAEYGQELAVEFLLARGADPLRDRQLGFSPLREAVQTGRGSLVAALVRYGGVEKDDLNSIPDLLYFCALHGDVEAVRVLLDMGANPQGGTADWRFAPMSGAATAGSVEVIELLAERGAPVQPEHDRAWTPLHSAAINARAEAIARLIALGADPRRQNGEGLTAGQLIERRLLTSSFDREEALASKQAFDKAAREQGLPYPGRSALQFLRERFEARRRSS